MASLSLSIKHGAHELAVTLPPDATVLALKQEVQAQTGGFVFARNMKLIHKGKVLADSASLASCKLASGAKLMLLASDAAAAANRGAAPGARPQALAPASRTCQPASSSSPLADKMAALAAARARPGGPGSGAAAAGGSMADRRAGWAKTGVVSLRDMQLAELQPDWFDGLAGARAADCSHNRLRALPASLCELTGLVSLKLTHNMLGDAGVPWAALCTGLVGLQHLLLGHNELRTLPACVSGLSSLQQLSLEACHLEQVQPGAFNGLGRLQVLALQHNRLAALPDSIVACSSLVALNVSCNALASLPDSMCRLAKLQVLAADSNRLTALPPSLLVGCASLCTLSAHANPITVEALRAAPGWAGYEARRQARTSKQLGGRVLADLSKAFSEGADVKQWERWGSEASGLGRDGSGRAGQR